LFEISTVNVEISEQKSDQLPKKRTAGLNVYFVNFFWQMAQMLGFHRKLLIFTRTKRQTNNP